MQKHILTFSFLLVLTLLFFYPKPSNLLELEDIKFQPHQMEKTKNENSRANHYAVFEDKEQEEMQSEESIIPHQPMP